MKERRRLEATYRKTGRDDGSGLEHINEPIEAPVGHGHPGLIGIDPEIERFSMWANILKLSQPFVKIRESIAKLMKMILPLMIKQLS
jgi:hypothetical protein